MRHPKLMLACTRLLAAGTAQAEPVKIRASEAAHGVGK
jgi:hypothetical protein